MSARAFYARKLFELSGLVPLGLFLVEHFYENFQVVGPGGAERFDRVVLELQSNPAIVYAEIFGIALPLLYHAVYGLFVAQMARPNNGAYGYLRNWTFLFQRVTGLVLIAFIGYHVYKTRLYPGLHPEDGLLQHVRGEPLVSTAYMHRYLGERLLGVRLVWLYLGAVGCAVYHLANGLWNLGVHWGLLVSRGAQRRAGWLCVTVGAALFYLGARSALTFYRPGE
jgi:succinate dehydrogenase / fumarate reductase, cytochrome b subunit